MTDSHERRNKSRHAHGNLDVQVRIAGLRGRMSCMEVVTWIDFSAGGMAFFSEEQYVKGTQLMLNLEIHDEQHYVIHDLPAKVKYCRQDHNGFRYGILFELDSKTDKHREMQETLKKIEMLLHRIYLRLTGNPHFPHQDEQGAF